MIKKLVLILSLTFIFVDQAFPQSDADKRLQSEMDEAAPAAPIPIEAEAPGSSAPDPTLMASPKVSSPMPTYGYPQPGATGSRVEPQSPALPEVRDDSAQVVPRQPLESKKDGYIKHPNAKKGLIKIDQDGNYIYQVPIAEKHQAFYFSISDSTAPKIAGTYASYSQIYGSSNPIGVSVGYDWFFSKKAGEFGLELGTAIFTATGNGVFGPGPPYNGAQAQEKYTLYTLPLEANLLYRFEYSKKQLLVPYISGGVSYYGLVEKRDDNKFHFAGAPAGQGMGGLLISVSKLDPKDAFSLSDEYGISDMWANLSFKAVQGFKNDVDVSGVVISLGVVVDY